MHTDYSITPFNTPAGSIYFPKVKEFIEQDFYQEEINDLNKKILDMLELDKQELAEIYAECKRKIEELKNR